eukprot:Opistho-2@74926
MIPIDMRSPIVNCVSIVAGLGLPTTQVTVSALGRVPSGGTHRESRRTRVTPKMRLVEQAKLFLPPAKHFQVKLQLGMSPHLPFVVGHPASSASVHGSALIEVCDTLACSPLWMGNATGVHFSTTMNALLTGARCIAKTIRRSRFCRPMHFVHLRYIIHRLLLSSPRLLARRLPVRCLLRSTFCALATLGGVLLSCDRRAGYSHTHTHFRRHRQRQWRDGCGFLHHVTPLGRRGDSSGSKSGLWGVRGNVRVTTQVAHVPRLRRPDGRCLCICVCVPCRTRRLCISLFRLGLFDRPPLSMSRPSDGRHRVA